MYFAIYLLYNLLLAHLGCVFMINMIKNTTIENHKSWAMQFSSLYIISKPSMDYITKPLNIHAYTSLLSIRIYKTKDNAYYTIKLNIQY